MTPADADRLARELRRHADAIARHRSNANALESQLASLRRLVSGESAPREWRTKALDWARRHFANWQRLAPTDLLEELRGFVLVLETAEGTDRDPPAWKPTQGDVDDMTMMLGKRGASYVFAYVSLRGGYFGPRSPRVNEKQLEQRRAAILKAGQRTRVTK